MEKHKNKPCFQLSLSIPSPPPTPNSKEFNPSCHAIFSSLSSPLANTIWPRMGFNVIFPLAHLKPQFLVLEDGWGLIYRHSSSSLFVSRGRVREKATKRTKKKLQSKMSKMCRCWFFVSFFYISPTQLFFSLLDGEMNYIKELCRTHVLKCSYGWGNRLRSLIWNA